MDPTSGKASHIKGSNNREQSEDELDLLDVVRARIQGEGKTAPTAANGDAASREVATAGMGSKNFATNNYGSNTHGDSAAAEADTKDTEGRQDEKIAERLRNWQAVTDLDEAIGAKGEAQRHFQAFAALDEAISKGATRQQQENAMKGTREERQDEKITEAERLRNWQAVTDLDEAIGAKGETQRHLQAFAALDEAISKGATRQQQENAMKGTREERQDEKITEAERLRNWQAVTDLDEAIGAKGETQRHFQAFAALDEAISKGATWQQQGNAMKGTTKANRASQSMDLGAYAVPVPAAGFGSEPADPQRQDAAANGGTSQNLDPGAYAIGGIGAGTADPQVHEIVANESNGESQSGLRSSSLAVASPVDDTPFAEEARQVGGSDSDQQKEFWQKNCPLLLLLFLIVLAIGLGVGFAVKNSRETESEAKVFASYSPSLSPSFSPTSFQDLVFASLPEETQEEIGTGNSTAQAKAFQWLMKDPNLPNLPDWRIVQRFALAVFFYATKGPDQWINTTNWLNYGQHECDWFSSGAYCYLEDCDEDISPCGVNFTADNADSWTGGWYLGLWMNQNQLEGVLPPEIYLLTSLTSIQLLGNSLMGALSSRDDQLLNLANLEVLDLSANLISGTIATEVFSLPRLTYLGLFGNALSGTLPSEVGVANVSLLALEENFLTGIIPTEILLCEDLLYLALDHNLVSGTIASEWGNLPVLQYFYVSANALTSMIPTELGRISTLEALDLGSNLLSSEAIPSEFGQLSNLELLFLERLSLEMIPVEIWQLTTLRDLFVQNNQLTGSVPTEIGLAASLEVVIMGSNFLSSTIPTEIGRLSHLYGLLLYSNDLSGSIPSEIESLPLGYLWVHNNSLTGTVPLLEPSISSLNLEDNVLLSGIIPEYLCMAPDIGFDCTELLCGCECACNSPAHNQTNRSAT
ncbi:LRR receptor-like serine threonine-protein kinase [Seminavis robusta]|uniref:LRR receptor-like serine threonine-protein kinase n=1 Tax=Seminavis robusta TaxID=568900 RepID=A0A9N8HQK9_9STRA|nr:LRR receptor-like serine threonine-protein kinase [Seminavis robusta]|eukprot:Sro1203_g252090.1 LRR receptor-like serine threonine-protein kinase (926) ;mRNA; r:16209-19159